MRPSILNIQKYFTFCLFVLIGCSRNPTAPPQTEDHPRYDSSYLIRSKQAFDQKDYAQALMWAKTSIQANPLHPESHYFLGFVYDKLYQFKDALYAYQKAIKLKPDYAEAHIGVCSIYYVQGEFAQAANFCLQAHRLSANDLVPLRLLTLIYIELDDIVQAQRFETQANALSQKIQEKRDGMAR